MRKHSPSNERIKRQYFCYLREARRYSEGTVDSVAKAISRFEADTGYRDFKSFHIAQAVAFKRRLSGTVAQRSGKILSRATLHATLAHLQRFFSWLAGRPGFRSHLQYSDADYFNLSENEVRMATARRLPSAPTVDEVMRALGHMPSATPVQRRDRAVVAFTLLTGARDGAIASFKMKHLNLDAKYVEQDGREVRTKFRKTFRTTFFPVPAEAEQILSDWVTFLRVEMSWSPDNPLFPATKVALDPDGKFRAAGLERAHWSGASRIRAIFRDAFEGAGLPRHNPHSLRHTLALLGEQRCNNAEEFKAWSQNLGHEGVMTTFRTYGPVQQPRQAEIIRALASPRTEVSPTAERIADAVIRKLEARQGRVNDAADSPEGSPLRGK